METIQNVLGGANHGWTLRKGAQEKQRFVEADQRNRIGEARGVEAIQQFHDACDFVTAEPIAAGFELGELEVESFRGHGDSPQRVTHGLASMRYIADDATTPPSQRC